MKLQLIDIQNMPILNHFYLVSISIGETIQISSIQLYLSSTISQEQLPHGVTPCPNGVTVISESGAAKVT